MPRDDNYFTPADKRNALANLDAIRKTVEATPVQTPCALCENFASGDCLKWGQTVPIEAREAGCPAWEEGLPF